MPIAKLLTRPGPRATTNEPAIEPSLSLPIELIVGLGNPGSGYSGNRHNVGFWTVNRLGRQLGIGVEGHGKQASVGEGSYAGRRLVLAKPRTFMNESGKAVRSLLQRYRLTPRQMVIVCDDLDLPVGRVRIRAQGSHGGQKGLRSIVEQIGAQDFARIRIGIGRPVCDGKPSYAPDVIADYVLANPPPAERELLDQAVARAVEALVCLLDEGVEAAMNRFNRDEPRLVS